MGANMFSIIEVLRKASVDKLFQVPTVQNCWPIWQADINNRLNNPVTVDEILNLGDTLSDIFRSTAVAGRGQGQVSAGGYGWEALVAWYLNICLIGTRTVVIKENKSLIPTPISKCKIVKYRNFGSNTESDLVAITFPDTQFYTNQSYVETRAFDTVLFNELSNQLSLDMMQTELCIIQCKTNWNDNAQIPMLWDMVYSANGFNQNNISIGHDNFSINDLAAFSYAFITMPSQSNRNSYKPQSTAVQRVANITGGNYWGYPSVNSVAQSVKEIFTRNFQNGFIRGGIRSSLTPAIPDLNNQYSYFRLN